MWSKISTIAWAQFRIMRNHLPRTKAGPVIASLLALLWYGLYAFGGVMLALVLPSRPLQELRTFVPIGLLAVLAFWQIIPLFTLSSGWSLQLNKLQIYPVPDSALFSIEVLLRFTTAPEMVLILCGALVGLLRHPGIGVGYPFLLLLFIPLNLFLSLGIRELILHSFARGRFRELFGVLLVSISILPQVFLRTSLGQRSAPYLLKIGTNLITPWREVGRLSTGAPSVLDIVFLSLWIFLSYWFARRQFQAALRQDDTFQSAGQSSRTAVNARRDFRSRLAEFPGRLFGDPVGALIEKEFLSLLRTPRFRVILGMATLFSIFLFFPLTLGRPHSAGGGFIHNNFLPMVTLYGLLLLSDSLLLNFFGFDRAAAQLYFVAPVDLQSVIRAKNIVAIFFVALQCLTVLVISLAIRIAGAKVSDIGMSIGAAAVVAIFYLAAGNLMSVYLARPIDPTQTFRKQAGGKAQLWFFLCSLGMFVLVGFAYLARWAFQAEWALLGVLSTEFLVGYIVYRVATQSAVEHGWQKREELIEKLSKNLSPIGFS